SPLDEEYSLESPLDEVDAYIHLQDKLAEMQSANAAVYDAIARHLSPENTQFVQSLMEEANKQREVLATRQQQN
ncbi:hypothetical protein IWW55_005345, partial [Coemansia sp. RSA 2706]